MFRLDGEVFEKGESGNFVRLGESADFDELYVLDLDAVLSWCSKPQPRPIEDVDQSDEIWEAIEFLDELEEDGLLDHEASRNFRLADEAACKILFARLNSVAESANLSVEESAKLQAMFESGIASLRRALPT